jgi:hypothetical protein
VGLFTYPYLSQVEEWGVWVDGDLTTGWLHGMGFGSVWFDFGPSGGVGWRFLRAGVERLKWLSAFACLLPGVLDTTVVCASGIVMLLLLLHGSSELVALDFVFLFTFIFRLAFGITDSSEFGSVVASLNGTFA